MTSRHCLCGARPDVKQEERAAKEDGIERVCWVECPVCGQLGPRITAGADADWETLRVRATEAWDEMLRRARPSER